MTSDCSKSSSRSHLEPRCDVCDSVENRDGRLLVVAAAWLPSITIQGFVVAYLVGWEFGLVGWAVILPTLVGAFLGLGPQRRVALADATMALMRPLGSGHGR